MIAHCSNRVTSRNSRNQKVAIIIGGVCVVVVILVTILAHLSQQPDFLQFVIYLSEVRVTPAWPQIGLFTTPVP